MLSLSGGKRGLMFALAIQSQEKQIVYCLSLFFLVSKNYIKTNIELLDTKTLPLPTDTES